MKILMTYALETVVFKSCHILLRYNILLILVKNTKSKKYKFGKIIYISISVFQFCKKTQIIDWKYLSQLPYLSPMP